MEQEITEDEEGHSRYSVRSMHLAGDCPDR